MKKAFFFNKWVNFFASSLCNMTKNQRPEKSTSNFSVLIKQDGVVPAWLNPITGLQQMR